jgi:hypothetical protein
VRRSGIPSGRPRGVTDPSGYATSRCTLATPRRGARPRGTPTWVGVRRPRPAGTPPRLSPLKRSGVSRPCSAARERSSNSIAPVRPRHSLLRRHGLLGGLGPLGRHAHLGGREEPLRGSVCGGRGQRVRFRGCRHSNVQPSAGHAQRQGNAARTRLRRSDRATRCCGGTGSWVAARSWVGTRGGTSGHAAEDKLDLTHRVLGNPRARGPLP